MGLAMFRRPLAAFLLLLLVCCTARLTPSPTPSADQMNVEEQAVYAALVKQMYTASTLVIMDNTATGPNGVEDTASHLDYVLQNMHDVTQATLDSFKARNEKAYPLLPHMDLGITYILLSQSQRNQIFGQNQSGWEVFYNNYPDAPGITALSRVGFDATLDQALVYIGTQSNWLAGAGYYILLRRADGLWKVDQKVMVWVS